MLVRALVILLLVLNLGVAVWWALHAPAPTPASEPAPLGVTRLQLLSEAKRPPATVASPATPVADAPSPAATATAVAKTEPAAAPTLAPVCFSFGPFADAAAANAARTRLQPLVTRSALREQTTATSGRGWRVYLPPQASAEEAAAVAQRIAAAGFSDLFVVREGAEANSVALGRYRAEDAARRRAEALIAAGFAVRTESLGEAHAVTWIDVTAAAGFDAGKAQATTGAAQQRTIACAGVR